MRGDNLIVEGWMAPAAGAGCRLAHHHNLAVCRLAGAGGVEVDMGPSGRLRRSAGPAAGPADRPPRRRLRQVHRQRRGRHLLLGRSEAQPLHRRRRATTSASPATQNSDCVGGDGDDYCQTGAGSDGCWGGPGDDVCRMGPGQDGCHGEGGRRRALRRPQRRPALRRRRLRRLRRPARLGPLARMRDRPANADVRVTRLVPRRHSAKHDLLFAVDFAVRRSSYG